MRIFKIHKLLKKIMIVSHKELKEIKLLWRGSVFQSAKFLNSLSPVFLDYSIETASLYSKV